MTRSLERRDTTMSTTDLGPHQDPMLDRANGSGDPIEALLRLTGRRPAVPDHRTRRVEAAVFAHWQADVGRHSRRRRIWMAAGLSAAATAAMAIGVTLRQHPDPLAGTPSGATVDVVLASPWSESAGHEARSPLRPGDRIAVGSTVATGERGRLALRLASRHSVRLDVDTRVTMLSDRVLSIDRGAVYVDSGGPGGAATGSIEIRTPLGSIRDIGTQFEVRWLASSLRVRVREGTITFDHTGTSVEVGAGHEVEVGENAGLVRREWAVAAPGLEWVGRVTPMLALEGRSLQEFLEWVARERGLRLQFASADLAGSAPGIALNGSIDGMTLDEALESVLLTCRMSHRIEGDVLIVRSSSVAR